MCQIACMCVRFSVRVHIIGCMCVYINLYDYSKTTLEIWLYGVHHAVAKASVQLCKKQFSGENLSRKQAASPYCAVLFQTVSSGV